VSLGGGGLAGGGSVNEGIFLTRFQDREGLLFVKRGRGSSVLQSISGGGGSCGRQGGKVRRLIRRMS